MRIEQLDKTRILIALGEKDLADHALSFERLNLHDPLACQFLKTILRHACAETGINLRNKRLLLEAMPHEKGCLLLLTISDPHHPRKVYHIKRNLCCMSYGFHQAENLLHCVQALYRLHEKHPLSAVYRLHHDYYLVLPSTLPLSRRCLGMAHEFADSRHGGRLFFSFLQEHAQALQSTDAIDTIGVLLEKHH